jgi:beta-lactamase regulating signal transducer with metallopeptidase domain
MPDLMIIAGIALKTSALLGVVGLVSVVLRRQSAAFDHLLWTSALALCVLMPIAVFLLPAHSVATLPTGILQVSSQSSSSTPNLTLTSILLALWLIGTSVVVMRELLADVGLSRWRRHARPLSSARWIATLAHTSIARGLDDCGMRVLESQHIASPCTWGVLRPVLLLPTAGDAWPESARRSALLHELAHVQRRDALSTLISRLACAIHWYNPLVWLAAERVRSLQERACDDAVLSAGAMPSEYAQFLLDVAAHVSGLSRPARAAIGMAHCSSLRTRIVAILDPAATRSQPQRLRVLVACGSLFAFTVLLATASVAVEDPPPPPPTPTAQISPVAPPLPIPPVPAIPATRAVPATPAIPAVPAVPPTLRVDPKP